MYEKIQLSNTMVQVWTAEKNKTVEKICRFPEK